MSIEKEVIDIIAEQLGVDAKEVTPEKSLVEDLNADSLDLTELTMECEANFGFDFSEDVAEKLTTVESVIKYVEEEKKRIDEKKKPN